MDVKSMLENATKAAVDYDSKVYERAYYNSRQSDKEPLSPWMESHFKSIACKPMYMYHGNEEDITDYLISSVVEYIEQTGVKDFVIGISGGADSATTLALFNQVKKIKKEINIHAWTLPINQKEAEVNLAQDVCKYLGITLNYHDLTKLHDAFLGETDGDIDNNRSKIRSGNIAARLRMTYLYDYARLHNGVVVSTDNFSEYTAGFWTINGDVGDFAPLQSFYKSTEIPMIASQLGLPEKFWRVTPTDGLGISSSDEDQLGMSYLEWDILATMFISVIGITSKVYAKSTGVDDVRFTKASVMELMRIGIMDDEKPTEEDIKKIETFVNRVYSTWFKRHGSYRVSDGIVNKLELFDYTESITSFPIMP